MWITCKSAYIASSVNEIRRSWCDIVTSEPSRTIQTNNNNKISLILWQIVYIYKQRATASRNIRLNIRSTKQCIRESEDRYENVSELWSSRKIKVKTKQWRYSVINCWSLWNDDTTQYVLCQVGIFRRNNSNIANLFLHGKYRKVYNMNATHTHSRISLFGYNNVSMKNLFFPALWLILYSAHWKIAACENVICFYYTWDSVSFEERYFENSRSERIAQINYISYMVYQQSSDLCWSWCCSSQYRKMTRLKIRDENLLDIYM